MGNRSCLGRGVPAVACGLVVVVLAGCGGDNPGSTSPSSTARQTTTPAKAVATTGADAKSDGVRLPDDARAAGRHACSGLTPAEAAERFRGPARAAGVERRFLELVTEPAPSVEGSAGYPRLVAALYATTVPPARRAQTAAGCAEELAATSHGG